MSTLKELNKDTVMKFSEFCIWYMVRDILSENMFCERGSYYSRYKRTTPILCGTGSIANNVPDGLDIAAYHVSRYCLIMGKTPFPKEEVL